MTTYQLVRQQVRSLQHEKGSRLAASSRATYNYRYQMVLYCY